MLAVGVGGAGRGGGGRGGGGPGVQAGVGVGDVVQGRADGGRRHGQSHGGDGLHHGHLVLRGVLWVVLVVLVEVVRRCLGAHGDMRMHQRRAVQVLCGSFTRRRESREMET